MEVTQEPEGSTGKSEKVEVINTTPSATTPSDTPATTSETVKNISVKVDLTQKPQEIKEPVNLLNDNEFFDKVTEPTEGDIKNDAKQKEKIDGLKSKLTSTTDSSSTSTTTPDARKKQAEKWIKAIDIAMIWGLKTFSGQADNVGLVTAEPDKKTLAEALADVMEEYKFNPMPLVTLVVTAVAVYGTPVTNAFESRKKIKAFRKTEEYEKLQKEGFGIKNKPPLDPATGEHKKRRGGQFKG